MNLQSGDGGNKNSDIISTMEVQDQTIQQKKSSGWVWAVIFMQVIFTVFYYLVGFGLSWGGSEKHPWLAAHFLQLFFGIHLFIIGVSIIGAAKRKSSEISTNAIVAILCIPVAILLIIVYFKLTSY